MGSRTKPASHASLHREDTNFFWCILGRTVSASFGVSCVTVDCSACLRGCSELHGLLSPHRVFEDGSTRLFCGVLCLFHPVRWAHSACLDSWLRPSYQRSGKAKAAGRRSGSSHLAASKEVCRSRASECDYVCERVSGRIGWQRGRTHDLRDEAWRVSRCDTTYLGPAGMAGALQRQGS